MHYAMEADRSTDIRLGCLPRVRRSLEAVTRDRGLPPFESECSIAAVSPMPHPHRPQGPCSRERVRQEPITTSNPHRSVQRPAEMISLRRLSGVRLNILDVLQHREDSRRSFQVLGKVVIALLKHAVG
jgi:hypothetical protein